MTEFSHVDEVLGSAIDRGDVPGVVAMAAARDRVVFRGAFGRRALSNLEREVETPSHVLLNTGRHTDSTGIGQTLQPSRNVHSVPENVVILDNDIALVNADTKLDAIIARCSGTSITDMCCHWVAQRNASTTLENSTSKPSPVVLTMRPRCSVIFGSISSARIDLSRLRVPSSSAPISREYPATSAAKIAARRRVAVMIPRPQLDAGPRGRTRGPRGCEKADRLASPEG